MTSPLRIEKPKKIQQQQSCHLPLHCFIKINNDNRQHLSSAPFIITMRLHIAAAFLSGALAQNDANLADVANLLGMINGTDADVESLLGMINGTDADVTNLLGMINGTDADVEGLLGMINGTDADLESLIGGMIGGNTMLGSNPCTYAPNTTCYPQHPDAPAWMIPGRPLCCSITPDGSLCNPDGQPCTGTEGENTTEEVMGESVCTYAPNTTCYPIIGHPICCLLDKDLCNSLGEPCFDASILASLDPAVLAAFEAEGGLEGLIGGIGPVIPQNVSDFSEGDLLSGGGMIGGNTLLGSSYCTYSPNITCFPSTNGFPPCCVEDPKPEGCGTGEYPECEKTAVGEPITGGDGTAEVVPPPSPATAATPEPTSSSNALVFSLAALVGAHVVASMSGMW
jgi:hypothetical protein